MSRKQEKAPPRAAAKATKRAAATNGKVAQRKGAGKAAAAPAARSGGTKRETRKRARAVVTGPLVLVVDDFKDGRDIVVEALEFSGLRAAEAADGHEALAKCRALQPDLVLMDLSLPGMDGWEVTRLLKQDPSTKGIKVIALTAHAQVDALDRARQAGADGVITKPCLPTLVVEQVRDMLGAAAPEGA